MRQFFVYILASKSRNLYVGVTNNLERRLWGEKRIKHLYRAEKIALIERENPRWKDLAADWF